MRYERGRIVLTADGDGAWGRMQAVRELARELELSCHDGSAFVYVTLDATDVLALAAMVRLVLVGELADATLSNERWTLTLRVIHGSLHIRVSTIDERMRRALGLLGFKKSGAPFEALRVLESLSFPAGRLLQRVLVWALGMEAGGVDAVLTSGSKLASLDALAASGRESRVGRIAALGSIDAGDPLSR